MDILLLYVFYFWILSHFFSCFLNNRALSHVKRACTWSAFFILQIVLVRPALSALVTFVLNCTLITLLCCLLYQGPVRKIIFISVAGCTLGMLTEIVTAFLLQILGYSLEDMAFIGSLTSKLILLGIVHVISLFQYQQAHNSPSYLHCGLLLGMTASSIIIIHTLFLLNLETTSPLYRKLSTLAIILLVFMNIAFFILYEKLSASADLYFKNLVMDRQVTYYEELRLNKDAQDTAFRREKHNFKDQLLAIRGFAMRDQCSQIIGFINELINSADFGLTATTQYNNLVLDALLGAKTNLAREHNIKYDCDISVPPDLPFSNVDICILIGNALENAFDACCREDLPFEKHIAITIKYKTDCLYCHFENSFSHKLRPSRNTLFHSTKSDFSHHGYGLSSINHIVDKYKGTMNITTENNIFSLKILLYSK